MSLKIDFLGLRDAIAMIEDLFESDDPIDNKVAFGMADQVKLEMDAVRYNMMVKTHDPELFYLYTGQEMEGANEGS